MFLSFFVVGIHNGTCVLIEKILGRKLVWLPCRHHVLEIVLRGVFEVFWNTTSGPNVPIFLRFKKGWDDIDQTKYKSGLEDENVASALIDDKIKIINFINNCLQVKIVNSSTLIQLKRLLLTYVY